MMKKPILLALLFAIILAIGLIFIKHEQARPIPGAERISLVTETLDGKRIGLIVNQSSLVGDKHLIDVLQEQHIDVKKLFAVEHGVRGTQGAGAIIDNSHDARSGLPIVSIYGKNKAPMKQDVQGIDVMVFDLQDVGVRFYTYLSSLHYVMESCAQYDIPLIVLDRPNPNIAFIDGPILEPQFQSFVGMHPIPVLHGMTLGELARMINGEGWLNNNQICDLTVIPVKNYYRSTKYVLPIKPSPNLPNQKSIELYPSLALFEATNISVGRGTDFPFQVLGGVHPGYGTFTFTPRPVPGAAQHPKLQGQKLYGKDLRKVDVKGLDIDIFINWERHAKELGSHFLTRPGWLDKLMGTDNFRQQISAGFTANKIRESWEKDHVNFQTRRAPYLLYPEE